MDWLTICAEGVTEDCIGTIQLVYLIALVIGVVLLAFIARRSRDLSTATLALIPVAIAINLAVGSIAVALRLPIYLDSIGTVLVGVLAGPWAGALTGLLSNLIWSLLPIPGGAGPVAAFFAPVAAVIGLMAGFWARQGVFRLRADDARVGRFLALATGIAATGIAFLVIQAVAGVPDLAAEDPDVLLANQTRFVVLALVSVAIGVIVGWLSGRSIFRLEGRPEAARQYLVGAATIAAGAFTFALVRLIFGPTGYFSAINGEDPDGAGPLGPLFGGANLTSLALGDPIGLIAAGVVAAVLAVLVYRWAGGGENARLFPVWVGGVSTGLVAAAISAPISAGVFGGVTGGGTDAVVALFRTLGLNVFQSAFAQGLTSDPLDKTISYTVVFLILGA
ncbi:MAG: hypothetical protein ABIQ58_02920, partial [Candidatus Limnocylindrales bacterium]